MYTHIIYVYICICVKQYPWNPLGLHELIFVGDDRAADRNARRPCIRYTPYSCSSTRKVRHTAAAALGKGQMGSALMGSLHMPCFFDRGTSWVLPLIYLYLRNT